MNPIDQLKSVLCDPKGECCVAGSDEDRAIVDRALQALAEPAPVPLLTQDDMLAIMIATKHKPRGDVIRLTEKVVRQKAGL